MEGGLELYPLRFEAATSFLYAGGPRGIEYIEFVLKMLLPLDERQSSGSVLTLGECLIQNHSLGKCDGALCYLKST